MNFLRFSRSSNLTQWRLNSRLKLKITMTLATLIILGGCGGSSDSSTGIMAEQPTELSLAFLQGLLIMVPRPGIVTRGAAAGAR